MCGHWTEDFLSSRHLILHTQTLQTFHQSLYPFQWKLFHLIGFSFFFSSFSISLILWKSFLTANSQDALLIADRISDLVPLQRFWILLIIWLWYHVRIWEWTLWLCGFVFLRAAFLVIGLCPWTKAYFSFKGLIPQKKVDISLQLIQSLKTLKPPSLLNAILRNKTIQLLE